MRYVSASLPHGTWLSSRPGFLCLGLRSGEPIEYRFCGDRKTVEITGRVIGGTAVSDELITPFDRWGDLPGPSAGRTERFDAHPTRTTNRR
ncbi:hypothetical protein PCASD_05415 [Puccinia coronata f. sp. avenae]|uniref:Uncharacterized protein n=1 Tax=Puccinia coronata f. sp. avenae TaxID=200324 RepID=A0A2N5SUK0_9BASI|nr:hypothetical protein PCASD_13337 [Puccinia coronata f. sp. avenae]PLW41621.1 hypothetical protein PCASD_05415 [Puccinia coronata f. sp. avenae]